MNNTHEAEMQFTINGTKYIAEECDANQWFWTSRLSESHGVFPSALEAQQDAIAHEKAEMATDSDNESDTRYWGAYHQSFNHRDYQ